MHAFDVLKKAHNIMVTEPELCTCMHAGLTNLIHNIINSTIAIVNDGYRINNSNSLIVFHDNHAFKVNILDE